MVLSALLQPAAAHIRLENAFDWLFDNFIGADNLKAAITWRIIVLFEVPSVENAEQTLLDEICQGTLNLFMP